MQEHKEIPWIYQYYHLIDSSSLFCCFNRENQIPFLSKQFWIIHPKLDDAIISVVYLKEAVSIKLLIVNTITLFPDTARYRLLQTASHLPLFLANFTPSFRPHVWVHRPWRQGQQTLQHATVAFGAYGVEQSLVSFLTITGYSDIDCINLCSHKYGRMLLESIVGIFHLSQTT
jgi:hypothetical protein